MQDKTINNALLTLRREGGEVKALAEQLLAMRGVNRLPKIIPKPSKRAQMRRILIRALSDGPKNRSGLMERVLSERPDIPSERLYWRTDAALSKLRLSGVVEQTRRGVWRLVER